MKNIYTILNENLHKAMSSEDDLELKLERIDKIICELKKADDRVELDSLQDGYSKLLHRKRKIAQMVKDNQRLKEENYILINSL